MQGQWRRVAAAATWESAQLTAIRCLVQSHQGCQPLFGSRQIGWYCISDRAPCAFTEMKNCSRLKHYFLRWRGPPFPIFLSQPKYNTYIHLYDVSTDRTPSPSASILHLVFSRNQGSFHNCFGTLSRELRISYGNISNLTSTLWVTLLAINVTLHTSTSMLKSATYDERVTCRQLIRWESASLGLYFDLFQETASQGQVHPQKVFMISTVPRRIGYLIRSQVSRSFAFLYMIVASSQFEC
jgi:hypothetical protein